MKIQTDITGIIAGHWRTIINLWFKPFPLPHFHSILLRHWNYYSRRTTQLDTSNLIKSLSVLAVTFVGRSSIPRKTNKRGKQMWINLSMEPDKVKCLSHSQLCLYLLRGKGISTWRQFASWGNAGGVLQVFYTLYLYIVAVMYTAWQNFWE